MTVSYFSRDDAEKAWNELPPHEKFKTKIVMQQSYYLVPYDKDDELIDQMNRLVRKGYYNDAIKLADFISDEKLSLAAQAHVVSHAMYPQYKGEQP
ncbi:MAG: hypothetical protein ACKO37_05555 [Vampirovibrionales bacterium]